MQSLVERIKEADRGYIIEQKGLVIQDKQGLTLEKWRQIGYEIVGGFDRSTWALGDWVNSVRGEWGDSYTMAMKVTGLTSDWLQQLSNVSRAFSYSDRKSINLAWSYFRYVLGLPHHDRMNFLKMAEIEGLTIAQFGEKIAAANRAKRTPEQQQVVEKRVAARKEKKAKTVRQPTIPKLPVAKCPNCSFIFKIQGHLVE